MLPDRPPGRECDGGPAAEPDRHCQCLTARSGADALPTIADGADIGRRRRAWIELSDERDLQLSLRLAAWREGYQAGRRDGYDRGYLDGFAVAVTGYKRAQLDAVRDLDLHLRRWDGLRRDFGRPRDGDFQGRQQHG